MMTKHTSPDDYDRRLSTYNSSTNTYTLSFDPDGTDNILTTVVLAVAELSDTDPLQMEPLGSSIDMDELEETIQLQQHGAVTIERIQVLVGDYRVTITADAEIQINPLDTT